MIVRRLWWRFGVRIDLNIESQSDLLGVRGQPHVGFRCFIWTTAAMTSGLGPLGPGFFRIFEREH